MKKLVGTGLALMLLLSYSTGALAMEVPTGVTVQNLNGSQQYIQTFTVTPDTDPDSLKAAPFDYEGYTYTFASITKSENRFSDSQTHTETVTVETDKKDLSVVLEALAPTLDYDDGQYAGTLSLDHAAIVTEAAGYESRSYTISDTKTYESLPSNDMAYISATAVKDGVTLNLLSVDWQVQATALVDDVLTPSLYRAVASYSAKSYYSAPTGYITTASYTGTVSCSGVESVTYTLTYLGKETLPEATAKPTPEPREDEVQTTVQKPALASVLGNTWLVAGAGAALLAIAVLAALLVRSRRELVRLRNDRVEIEDAEYEEDTEGTE